MANDKTTSVRSGPRDRHASARSAYVLIVLLVSTLVLAACDDDDDDSKNESGTWTSKRTDHVEYEKND